MKNKIKVNTAQLRAQINAEINSGRIINATKVAMDSFDRKSLKFMKSNVESFDSALIQKLLSSRGGYRVINKRA